MGSIGQTLRDWLSIGGVTWATAALIALAPAAFHLVQAAVLGRRAGDPALAERLAAANRRSAATLGVAAGLLIVGWTSDLVWTLPLLLLARLASAYPFRKLRLGETWSLGTYLSFFLRLLVALAGFWILVVAMPALASRPEPTGWIVALVLAALLLVWNEHHAASVAWLLRARTVDDPELVARFAELVSAAGLAAPRFEQVDLKGGVFANAIALPSLRGSRVLVSGTLLERLDRDEVVAICAHELAHLEQYDRVRLRRLGYLSRSLIVLGALWSPMLGKWVPGFPWPAVWPGVVVIALATLARRRQRDETAGDLRAVALTGDAEALARALSKLHAIAHVPRRWDIDLEQRASHPSLARRLRAIRASAGAAPSALEGPASFHAPGGAGSVTFHDEHIDWVRRGLAPTRFAYGDLSELRVEARWWGRARLLAADATGRRWRLPLAPGDVARVQAVLDTVDARLAEAMPRPHAPVRLTRLVAALTVVIALVGPQSSVVALGALGCLVPAAPLAAAAGAAAMVSAGLTWREAEYSTPETRAALILLLAGFALVALAAQRRREVPGPWAFRFTIVLGLFAAASAATFLLGGVRLGGGDALGLYAVARAWPAATLWPIAFAAATVGWRSIRARLATAAALAAGLLAAAAATTAFVDLFSRDPLLLPADAAQERGLEFSRARGLVVDFEVFDLRLSPSGRAVALVSEGEDEQTVFHVGDVRGSLTPFKADDGRFVDDEHVVLLAYGNDGLRLREIAIASSDEPIWEQRLPEMRRGQLALDATGRRWSVLGRARDASLVLASGVLGSETVERRRWTVPDEGTRRGWPIAAAGAHVLLLYTDYASRADGGLWRRLVAGGPIDLLESRFVRVGPDGVVASDVSRLDVNCQPSPVSGEPPLCAVFDGNRTRIVTLDPAAGPGPALVSLPGQLYVDAFPGGGWLTGWWSGAPVALKLETREAFRLGPADEEGADRLVMARRALAVLTEDGPRSTVRVFMLNSPES